MGGKLYTHKEYGVQKKIVKRVEEKRKKPEGKKRGEAGKIEQKKGASWKEKELYGKKEEAGKMGQLRWSRTESVNERKKR